MTNPIGTDVRTEVEGPNKSSPLIEALPPATDYLTYLTILEYNLTKDQLPLLHNLLQDEKLTSNIGWDLVHLLIPLLPESEQCLLDIACLGNPRETVLKVAELLEEIGHGVDAEEDENEQSDADSNPVPQSQGSAGKNDGAHKQKELLVAKFQVLLNKLCVLHPRIKTKHPSRFLVTSMEAILRGYEALAPSSSATRAVLMFLKSISGSTKPHLPPRGREEPIPTVKTASVAEDPETPAEASLLKSEGEESQKARLLCSFLSRVTEVYVNSLSLVGESSGMAWSDRCMEKMMPQMIVSRRKTYGEMFREQTELEDRDITVRQILSTADLDLAVQWSDMASAVARPADQLIHTHSSITTAELPFSPIGGVYMVAAKALTEYLTGNRSPTLAMSIFGEHDELTTNLINMSETSMEPPSLIDSLVVLGWIALRTNGPYVEPESSAEFYAYLQRLSLISATTPLSSLRYQSHVLSTTVLYSHRSSKVRFGYILDTLEHCPLYSIKASAVGWMKDEVLAAFGIAGISKIMEAGPRQRDEPQDENIFRSPTTMQTLWPYIFPALDVSIEDLSTSFPFWLASLNFYYVLCSSSKLYREMEVAKLSDSNDTETNFLQKLRAIAKQSRDPASPMFKESTYASEADLFALEDALDRLEGVIQRNR